MDKAEPIFFRAAELAHLAKVNPDTVHSCLYYRVIRPDGSLQLGTGRFCPIYLVSRSEELVKQIKDRRYDHSNGVRHYARLLTLTKASFKPVYVRVVRLAEMAETNSGAVYRSLWRGLFKSDGYVGAGQDKLQPIFLASRKEEILRTLLNGKALASEA